MLWHTNVHTLVHTRIAHSFEEMVKHGGLRPISPMLGGSGIHGQYHRNSKFNASLGHETLLKRYADLTSWLGLILNAS